MEEPKLGMRGGLRSSISSVAAPLVSLHIAPDAKRLSTAGMWTSVRLLARMAVAVDPETARPGEGLATDATEVPFVCL